jgi:hypothetical protein
MTSRKRVEAMASALQKIDDENIAGDVVECGVWKGGNIILARKMSPDRVCWLYDTFEGMTEPGKHDHHRDGESAKTRYDEILKRGGGWCRAPLDQVKDNLAVTGVLDETKLRFVVGSVEKTLLKPENIPEQIAICRLDTDWHDSTKIELEMLYPKLASGGVLIVDDYGHWKGARKAVDDYFKSKFNPIWIDYTAVFFVKPITA